MFSTSMYCLLSLALYLIFLFVTVLPSIVITSLGKDKVGLYRNRVFVCLFCMRQCLSFSSSFWCHVLVVTCDWWHFLDISFYFFTYEPPHDKTNKMACAPSEDSDPPGYPPNLIRVFAVCMKKAWVLSYPLSAQ